MAYGLTSCHSSKIWSDEGPFPELGGLKDVLDGGSNQGTCGSAQCSYPMNCMNTDVRRGVWTAIAHLSHGLYPTYRLGTGIRASYKLAPSGT